MNEAGEMSLAVLVTLAIATVSMCVRPSRARCPIGYDLRTGVQRSGAFVCWPSPTGNPMYDGAGGYPERSVQSNATIGRAIYCTGGARPIVVDYRTVGCQR